MANNKEMVAFGTSFRGYRKADVNQFIERKANEFAKKEEEFMAELQRKNAKYNEAVAEGERLGVMLAESDRVIMELKTQINEQNALIEDLKATLTTKDAAFDELNREVEQMSSKIAYLANEKTKHVEQTSEKKEAPKADAENKTDSDSISNALKTIKNKILSFLK